MSEWFRTNAMLHGCQHFQIILPASHSEPHPPVLVMTSLHECMSGNSAIIILSSIENHFNTYCPTNSILSLTQVCENWKKLSPSKQGKFVTLCCVLKNYTFKMFTVEIRIRDLNMRSLTRVTVHFSRNSAPRPEQLIISKSCRGTASASPEGTEKNHAKPHSG
jgi:hypothetical protein